MVTTPAPGLSWATIRDTLPATAVEVEERLREISFGACEGMTRDEIAAAFPAFWPAYEQGLVDTFPDGEPRAAFAARVAAAIRELASMDWGSDLLVVAHRDRLERVIGHLVQNAIEATPSSGSVRIEAGRDGRDVLVNVIDTGAGMSREFIDTQLFKPFSSTKEHGMGIGAFESREYIREIGGSLAVASTEGRGTRFTVRLPVHGETGATSLERTADVG